MTINSYINFNGNCKEAVEFYGKVFGATPKIMTFEEIPQQPDFPIPEEMKKLVMHANLNVCDNIIMFSDVMPDMEYICGNNISLSLLSDNKEQLTDWFQKLSVGGEVIMPLAPTFWSELYGLLTDQFGIGWQINCSTKTC